MKTLGQIPDALSKTSELLPITRSELFLLAGFCTGLAIRRDTIRLDDFDRDMLRKAGEALRIVAANMDNTDERTAKELKAYGTDET